MTNQDGEVVKLNKKSENFIKYIMGSSMIRNYISYNSVDIEEQ